MSPTFVAFGLGTTELVILLVIVVLVFGVGKLGDVGKELGKGIKNFKSEVAGDDATPPNQLEEQPAEQTAIPGTSPRSTTSCRRSAVPVVV